jgi:hypothetical protein
MAARRPRRRSEMGADFGTTTSAKTIRMALPRLLSASIRGQGFDDGLKHDPEKWEPVFGKDHAQTKS